MSLSFIKQCVLSIVAVCAVGMFSLSGSTPVLAGCDGTINPRDSLGVDCVSASGLSNRPIGVVVGRIIQVALSLIGIIVVVLIIFAGFRWMTAAGNPEQIEKAKKTLIAAVIGLTIILMAYSLTTFIVGELHRATGG